MRARPARWRQYTRCTTASGTESMDDEERTLFRHAMRGVRRLRCSEPPDQHATQAATARAFCRAERPRSAAGEHGRAFAAGPGAGVRRCAPVPASPPPASRYSGASAAGNTAWKGNWTCMGSPPCMPKRRCAISSPNACTTALHVVRVIHARACARATVARCSNKLRILPAARRCGAGFRQRARGGWRPPAQCWCCWARSRSGAEAHSSAGAMVGVVAFRQSAVVADYCAISTTACAARPSARPMKPSFSVVVALRFTQPASHAQRRGHAGADGITMAGDARRFGQQRGIRIHHAPASFGQQFHRMLSEPDAGSAPPLRIGIREMLADVAEAGSAEQCIRQRMLQHIAVGVCQHAVRVRDTHAAQHHRIPGTEGMHVEATAGTHVHRGRSSRQQRSGQRQVRRRRDLDIAGAAGDEARGILPAIPPPALHRWVRDRQPVRPPVPGAAGRGGTSAVSVHATAFAPRRLLYALRLIAALQRVGQRRGQQSARGVGCTARQQRIDLDAGHAGTGGIVHQHPGIIAAGVSSSALPTESQRRAPPRTRRRRASRAGGNASKLVSAASSATTTAAATRIIEEGSKRVVDHAAAGKGKVLLGHGTAETAPAARGRHDQPVVHVGS